MTQTPNSLETGPLDINAAEVNTIGNTSAAIQTLPAADDHFARARADAVAHHIKTLRHAIGALRGLGEHGLLAALLADELSDTVTEARSIEARKTGPGNTTGNTTGRRRMRLAPTGTRAAQEIN